MSRVITIANSLPITVGNKKSGRCLTTASTNLKSNTMKNTRTNVQIIF